MTERKEYTVQELLELAHKYKCTRIKTGPLEIELSPSAFAPTGGGEMLDLGEPVPTAEEFQFMAGLQLEKPDSDGSN